MKSKIYMLGILSSFFMSTTASASYGAIICEPLGDGSFLCDAYVQNVNPSNATYNWSGAGVNVQGAGNSAYVSCGFNSSSGSVTVSINDAVNGNTTLSRSISCGRGGGGFSF